jgi:hypothetical protein
VKFDDTKLPEQGIKMNSILESCPSNTHSEIDNY